MIEKPDNAEIESEVLNIKPKNSTADRSAWVWGLMLVGILMIGAYFRLVGVNWDQEFHLHPDERFMTMVETSIAPVEHFSDYFNTEQSTLNPNNRGFGFYVYGTLPLFMVRYVAEWLGETGYGQVYLVGRVISALFDLMTIVLIYFIAVKLYRKPKLGLLAAALYSFSALPIQLSHYFTVDAVANFFVCLTIYTAVLLMKKEPPEEDEEESSSTQEEQEDFNWSLLGQDWDGIGIYLLFGTVLGMAVASKVSAAPVAILLPLAALIYYTHLTGKEKDNQGVLIWRNMLIAALMSLLVFRIFQPFAFTGPGFFNIKINPKWIASLKDLSQQSSGAVDFPPALQWARRPITYAFTNMVQWGMGLPFGILAWASFLWMGYQILKGRWREHSLLWAWTLLYFAWQSMNFSRNMRYQIHIYPTLAIIAAWMVFWLWDQKGRLKEGQTSWWRENWRKTLSVILGLTVFFGTFAWGTAFTQIYTRPVTRVAASEWIYQNVPGPVNLQTETASGPVNHPEPFRAAADVTFDQPLVMAFQPKESGTVLEVDFSHILSLADVGDTQAVMVSILDDRSAADPLTTGYLVGGFTSQSDHRGEAYQVIFDQAIPVEAGQQYYLVARVPDLDIHLQFMGAVSLSIATSEGVQKQYLPEMAQAIPAGGNMLIQYRPEENETLNSIYLPHIVDWEGTPDSKTLQVFVYDSSSDRQTLGTAEISNRFAAQADVRGEAFTFTFDQPIQFKAGETYYFQFVFASGAGRLAFYGSKQVNESSWDDSIPLAMDGYNPFDNYTGVYQSDLNFEMYWDDNSDKLDRFLSNLEQADYIYISSNRQWATTTRVPERYPLTTEYYRNLLGCPVDDSILQCYADAQPGMYQGNLGFDLIQVFQSEPNLGYLVFNTQLADESFTVYDHPKVFIFKKNADYDPDQVKAILGAVDLSNVIHVAPKDVPAKPEKQDAVSQSIRNLMLPESILAEQQAGGTWSEIFNRNDWANRYPGLGLILWYLVVAMLGLVNYPLVHLVFNRTSDRGYPVSRLVGVLLLAFFTWLAGSQGIAFSRLTISLVFVGLLAVNAVLYWLQRAELREEFKTRKKYFLMIEGVFLAFFVVDLLIRIGNPDLWHPYKGGERPMELSYLNAVIKSTTFPPYDPWFSGGFINYYYYGYVIAGVLIKWLAIIPSIAYNFMLPTLFAMVAVGAFSIAWNILGAFFADSSDADSAADQGGLRRQFKAGLFASIGLLILGNLGTVRMIWQGWQKLAAPGGNIEDAGFFTHWLWSFQGFIKYLGGSSLPYRPGDWYWIPSRAIPGEPITEFPMFTFLYSDMHAHMIALPITLLALGWAVSLVIGRWKWGNRQGKYPLLHFLASFFVGGVVIGALRPTNTWDLPAYWGLALLAVVYTALRFAQIPERILPQIPDFLKRILLALGSAGLLTVLVFVLYKPFSDWYVQGYNAVKIWNGDRTPFWSYFTHWGLFLFVIVSWLVWEAIDWMSKTPASALSRLRPYRSWLQAGAAVLALLILGSFILKIQIAWLVLPLSVLALILIFRPGQSDSKRIVLILAAAGLMLSLAVEIIVLDGDIGRMNTVFKFYMQVWTLLSISSALGLYWLLTEAVGQWKPGFKNIWNVALALLVGSAAMFSVAGTLDKVNDRMSSVAPHSLDGMTYMATSYYSDSGQEMALVEDYRAIKWMQDNVQGSPTIVEANTSEYRWGSRYTIYTGLPGVLGWNWHQRQQRNTVPSEWVTNRVADIGAFYTALDRESSAAFLQQYNVKYIIVGQLERAYYSGPGLEKFDNLNGDLWNEVYRDGQTVIYQVLN